MRNFETVFLVAWYKTSIFSTMPCLIASLYFFPFNACKIKLLAACALPKSRDNHEFGEKCFPQAIGQSKQDMQKWVKQRCMARE